MRHWRSPDLIGRNYFPFAVDILNESLLLIFSELLKYTFNIILFVIFQIVRENAIPSPSVGAHCKSNGVRIHLFVQGGVWKNSSKSIENFIYGDFRESKGKCFIQKFQKERDNICPICTLYWKNWEILV